MSYIFTFTFLISIIYAIFFGKTEEITNSLVVSCQEAVSITIDLAGAMAFWGGIMNVAKESRLVDLIVKFLSPILKIIFNGLNKEKEAFKAVSLNIVANLLGLGNAATPLGIKAVREISKEENTHGKISRNMATFIMLNTASIQLIPVTVATLRQKYGAKSPFDITPCILAVSLISVIAGVTLVKILYLKGEKGK